MTGVLFLIFWIRLELFHHCSVTPDIHCLWVCALQAVSLVHEEKPLTLVTLHTCPQSSVPPCQISVNIGLDLQSSRSCNPLEFVCHVSWVISLLISVILFKNNNENMFLNDLLWYFTFWYQPKRPHNYSGLYLEVCQPLLVHEDIVLIWANSKYTEVSLKK